MITVFAIISFLLCLGFGALIHVVYKAFYRNRTYPGLTRFEIGVISIGSIPGFAGCASGWIGFGFPVPLILGVPLDVFIHLRGMSGCDWGQFLLVGDLGWDIVAFPQGGCSPILSWLSF